MKRENETKVMRRHIITMLLALVLVGTLAFGFVSCDKTDVTEGAEQDDGVDSAVDSDSESESETTADEAEDTTAAEQEVLGSGTADDPYLVIPVDMTVTTEKIAAGGKVYYAIYRSGGKQFSISSADASVVCEGVTYAAENGVVSFKIPDALASDAVLFEISNVGSQETAFDITLTSVPGSIDAPVKVDKLDKDITVSIPEGATQGFFYNYIAEKTGTIRFHLTSTEEAAMSVDRIRNTTEVFQVTLAEGQVDADGNPYLEIEVNEGDELRINVSAVPTNRGKYPAVDVTWNGAYN